MSSNDWLELSKIIYCQLTYDKWVEVMEIRLTDPYQKADFDKVFFKIKENLFLGLCELDVQSLEKLYVWAYSILQARKSANIRGEVIRSLRDLEVNKEHLKEALTKIINEGKEENENVLLTAKEVLEEL